MIVIGGATEVWGALVGSALLTLLKVWLQDLLPKLFGRTGNFELVAFGLLMALVMLRTRRGIMPYVFQLFPPAPIAIAPAAADPLPKRPALQPREVLLSVSNARKQFGGLTAVHNVSFTLNAHEIVGLIGPNGAGKTTLFNLISGTLALTAGEIAFRGRQISGVPSRTIAAYYLTSESAEFAASCARAVTQPCGRCRNQADRFITLGRDWTSSLG